MIHARSVPAAAHVAAVGLVNMAALALLWVLGDDECMVDLGDG